MRFTLAPSATRLETVGRHLIVFDELSSDTHVLNEAAGALLLAISEAPRTMSEVVELLADLLVESERPRAAAHAQATVDQLRSLGLVLPAGSRP
ncbi:MAG: HPr-rel-A system PqqD family peptide chaperone [Burkholderiaceae bacterium]